MGLPSWNVNTCAMGHCLITLYEYTGDKKYWDLVMSKIDYLRNDALRFGDHVLQHTVSSNNDFPEQCWADTLFMAAFLMLRVGSKLRMLNPCLLYTSHPNAIAWFYSSCFQRQCCIVFQKFLKFQKMKNSWHICEMRYFQRQKLL